MNAPEEQGETEPEGPSSSAASPPPAPEDPPHPSPPRSDPGDTKPEEEGRAARPARSDPAVTAAGSGAEGGRAYVRVPACGSGHYRLYRDSRDPGCACAFCRCERTVRVGTVCIDCQVRCEDPEKSHF